MNHDIGPDVSKLEAAKNTLVDKGADLKDRIRETATDMKERVVEGGTELKNRADRLKDELADKAHVGAEKLSEKVDSGLNHAGESMHQLADGIRERASNDSPVGQQLNQLASTLDASGSYLAQHGIGEMQSDLTAVVRKHPVAALSAGFFFGVVLGAVLSSNRE